MTPRLTTNYFVDRGQTDVVPPSQFALSYGAGRVVTKDTGDCLIGQDRTVLRGPAHDSRPALRRHVGHVRSEVANAGGYARQAVTFDAAASGATQNAATMTWPTATGSWGTITAIAVVDSATHGAGNVIAYGALAAPAASLLAAPEG